MKLTILGTSDLHGQLLGYEPFKDETADNGGMARLCAYVRQVRAENPNTLLLDAGDVLQGGILTDTLCSKSPDEPNPLLTAMNLMGYDAMTLGNHEFDWGIPNLKKVLSQAEFSVLAANVRDAKGEFLTGNGWKIFRFGEVRVAVIGVVTPDIPIWNGKTEGVAEYQYLPAADAVREAIAQIGTDADLFVVSAHMGLYPEFDEENDSDSAQKILDENPGITVLQVGHNHVVVRQKQGETLIGGVRNNGLDVARFDLTLDSQNRVVDGQVEIVDMSGILPDEEFQKLPFVRDAYERTRQLLSEREAAGEETGEVIGTATAEFAPGDAVQGIPQALFRNNAVMELIHRVQLKSSGADVSATPLYRPDAGLPAGELHEADVETIYPFENLLYCVPVTGAELKAYMEWSVAAYKTATSGEATICLPPDVPCFRFDTFAGVEYEIDLRQPEGDRIRNLRFRGEPLQDEQVLTLAVNNFRYASVLKGEKLVSGKKMWQSSCTIPELLKDYVRKNTPLTPEVVDNWKVIGTAAL